MSLVVIEDKAPGSIDVGFLSAVGIVFASDGIPSAGSPVPAALVQAGQARTWSSSFFGCRVMRVSRNPDLLMERDHVILSIGSVMNLTQKLSGIRNIWGFLQSLSL